MATNTLRLLKELSDIQKNPDQGKRSWRANITCNFVIHADTFTMNCTERQQISRRLEWLTDFHTAIYVSYNEDDITNVKALIIGPPDTPYEYGFFEFNMQFPRGISHSRCLNYSALESRNERASWWTVPARGYHFANLGCRLSHQSA
jgi:ubiquitin-protein ligase